MADKITFEILEDGTIKSVTDAVSMPNHSSADGLLISIGKLAGGLVKRAMRMGVRHSLAGALHAHAHDGHTHQH